MEQEELLVVTMGRGTASINLQGLETKGFQVWRAHDPLDGIVQAHRRSYSTVLLDLTDFKDREKNFLNALGRAAPDARLLGLISDTSAGQTESMRKSGVAAVLPKPFEMIDLITLLRSKEGKVRGDADAIAPLRPQSTFETEPLSSTDIRYLPFRCLELLRDWTKLLTRDLNNIEEILTLTLDLPVKEFKARRASLLLFDDARETLLMRRWVGFPAGVDPRKIRIHPGEGITGLVAQQGKPLVVANLNHEKALSPSKQRSYLSSSLLSVPIRHGGTVLGVLNLTDREDGAPFNEAERELVLAIAHQAGAFIENARMLKKMETLSIVDELTGLFNRRYFQQCLENETIRARRYKRFLTLALLDIDGFKEFNDTNGYLKGDQVLKGVARILKENFRKTDIVTRWGGEEFAILLPETEKPDPTKPNAALHFTERVRNAVESKTFERSSALGPARITISGGVATFPTDTLQKQDLLAKANAALKRAKTSGKNQICVFGEQI